jgi:hypothetical protein
MLIPSCRSALKPMLAALFLFCLVASGQEYRGRVQGNVTDPSKAAIVGAKVTLKNVATGVETTRETDASGFYRFDFVQPGTYTLTVESPGFNRYIQENIRVLTAGDVTVNVEMTLGAVTEAVTVTAEVAAVQFNTSTMTTTVQANIIRDLPVLARNPFTLALLNPAVVNQYWDVSHRNPFYMWSNSGLDIGGSTGGKNDQLLDGVPTGVAARGSYNSPMDAVQEVVVQQNAVDAEFGFSAGGVLNLSMKSGTNEVHGTAYYFGRNPYFNAVVEPITRTPSFIKNHIWGGTLGNPIKKNKLFSFFVYEQWRQTQPTSNVSTVPTDLERQGDFSQTRTPTGALRMIYDPFSTKFDPATSTVTRTPFPGNRIPGSMINPTGRIAVNDLWKPNNPGDDLSGINNFKTSYSWWHRYWNISERVDYNATDRLRMYFRWSMYRTDLDNPNWGGTRAVRSDNGGVMDADNAAVDGIYMFSPTTTLNMRFGYTRAQDDYDSQWAKVGEGVWAELWPNGWYKPVTAALPGIYYPNFNFSGNGGASSGIGGWWLVREYQTNLQANMTHTRGMHTMKFGVQWRNSWEKNGQPAPGGFTFNSVETGRSFLGYDPTQSGSQFATALLGVVSSGNTNISPMWHLMLDQYAFYFQDDIKLTRNVTLNLGLRYEYETAPAEKTRMFTRLVDLAQPIPELQAGVRMPAAVTAIRNIPYKFNGAWVFTDDNNARVFDSPKTNFLPRIGVAVRLTDRMSFRAGYARYATPFRTVYTEGWDVPKYGFSQPSNALGPLEGLPRTLINDPFPVTNPLILPPQKRLGRYTQLGSNGHWFNQDIKTPMNDRFNISIQRQLPLKMLFDGTYFMHLGHNVHDVSMWGSWGTNYWEQVNMMDPNLAYTYKGAVDAAVPNPFYNLLPPDKMPGELRNQKEVPASQLLRPYPQYTDLNMYFRSGLNNRYYAMQLQLQRPMAQGVSLQLGYNYNREFHDEWFNDIDEYNKKKTMMDRRRPRHNLRVAGTWELPLGRGKKYLNNVGRALDLLVGGWATAHWLMWQGGELLTFGPAEVTGDPRQNVPPGLWFNPKVFKVLPPYTPRTNPWYYDGLRGPRFWSLDSTLVKYTPITERVKLELRFEFYNMPNHFIPSSPDTGIGSGTMGQSTWVFPGNYGREVQYTARFHF